MKYIKKFENIEFNDIETKYKVGDYIEIDDETIEEFNFDRYAEITEVQNFKPTDRVLTQYELTDLDGELLYLFDDSIIRKITDEEFELFKNTRQYGL